MHYLEEHASHALVDARRTRQGRRNKQEKSRFRQLAPIVRLDSRDEPT
jgi:hypothetical protein